MSILVCPLRLVEATITERRPSHLITLLSPEEMIATPAGFDPTRHLRLGVHDIAEPMDGLTHPDAALVEQFLDFASDWDASAPLLIHCWAGISRSTATAYALACARNPHADEYVIARTLRQASHTAWPNRAIVAVADDILDRRGRMLAAVEAIGGNNYEIEGVPFELAARH
jgi:predicted protein tyrosine phosphatase